MMKLEIATKKNKKHAMVFSVYPELIKQNIFKQRGYQVLDLSELNSYMNRQVLGINGKVHHEVIYDTVDPQYVYELTRNNMYHYDIILVSAEYSLQEKLLKNGIHFSMITPLESEKKPFLDKLLNQAYTKNFVKALDVNWTELLSYTVDPRYTDYMTVQRVSLYARDYPELTKNIVPTPIDIDRVQEPYLRTFS